MANFQGNFEYVGDGGELTAIQEGLIRALESLGNSGTNEFIQKTGVLAFSNKNVPPVDLSSYETLKKVVVDYNGSVSPVVVVVGDIGKILTMNNGATKVFNLPVIVSGNIGTQITFIKKGAGQVTIQANTGQTIDDGASDGTVYNNVASELTATITLLAISTTQWVIVGFNGTWTIT